MIFRSIFIFSKQKLNFSNLLGFIYLVFSLDAVTNYFLDRGDLNKSSDYIYLGLIALQFLYSIFLIRRDNLKDKGLFFFLLPEVLFVINLLVFLFFFIYSKSGNLDYAKRINGNTGFDLIDIRVKLSIKFIPYFLPFLIFYILSRVLFAYDLKVKYKLRYKLLFCFLTAVLTNLAQPSLFLNHGYFFFAYICYIPIFIVLYTSSYFENLFYFIASQLLSFTITNFWLGTYSLLTLQGAIILMFTKLLVFYSIAFLIFKKTRSLLFILPALLCLFDYCQNLGFFAYPWAYIGYSQYKITGINQITSITGIWGLNFIIYQINSCIAKFFCKKTFLNLSLETLLCIILIGSTYIYSVYKLNYEKQFLTNQAYIKVSVIQQNLDPRKSDDKQNLEVLKKLTKKAVKEFEPQIVVWPETAFSINLRRWILEDKNNEYTKLAQDFYNFQKSIKTYLLLGNDDYFIVNKKRYDYNAAILFSPDNTRLKTYHKIKLVPITEYFPYKNTFPQIYEYLQNNDSNFWQKGNEQSVFFDKGLGFSFSSPICFEDSFPNFVRGFVKVGSQVIINISNDYWSQEDAQINQHFMSSIFRAIENNVPLIRSSTSGVSGLVSPMGKVIYKSQNFKKQYLNIKLPLSYISRKQTIYNITGDFLILFVLFCIIILNIFFSIYKKPNIYNV